MTTCATCGRTRHLTVGETYRHFWPCGCSVQFDVYEHRPVVAGEERFFRAATSDANGHEHVADHPTAAGAIAACRAKLEPYTDEHVVESALPSKTTRLVIDPSAAPAVLKIGDRVTWKHSDGTRWVAGVVRNPSCGPRGAFADVLRDDGGWMNRIAHTQLGGPIAPLREHVEAQPPTPTHHRSFKVGDHVEWLTHEKREPRSGTITHLSHPATDGAVFAEIRGAHDASWCVNTQRLRRV